MAIVEEERKGKERKGKERKGKERKGKGPVPVLGRKFYEFSLKHDQKPGTGTVPWYKLYRESTDTVKGV